MLSVTFSIFLLTKTCLISIHHNAIAGFEIKKGWRVNIDMTCIHVNPKLLLDPMQFNPSRFDVPVSLPKHFVFLLTSFIHRTILNHLNLRRRGSKHGWNWACSLPQQTGLTHNCNFKHFIFHGCQGIDIDCVNFLQEMQKPYSYTPFGSGTRSSLGTNMAKATIMMFLYRVVSGYRWVRICSAIIWFFSCLVWATLLLVPMRVCAIYGRSFWDSLLSNGKSSPTLCGVWASYW